MPSHQGRGDGPHEVAIAHAEVVECAVVGYEEEGLTLSRAHVVLRAGSTLATPGLLRHEFPVPRPDVVGVAPRRGGGSARY